MPRPVPGIQLGRTHTPALLRALEVAAVGLALAALWGGISLLETRSRLEDAPNAAVGATATTGSGEVAFPGRAHQAAVLLLSGALDTPALSTAIETLRQTAPSGIRIVSIEVRPQTNREGIEASIAAESDSAAAIARFLASLGGQESVLSTEVISETRQTNGGASLRITTRLAHSKESG